MLSWHIFSHLIGALLYTCYKEAKTMKSIMFFANMCKNDRFSNIIDHRDDTSHEGKGNLVIMEEGQFGHQGKKDNLFIMGKGQLGHHGNRSTQSSWENGNLVIIGKSQLYNLLIHSHHFFFN
jgi:hypothetical protein